MVSNESFKELPLLYPETTEAPHRNMLCYKIKGKILLYMR